MNKTQQERIEGLEESVKYLSVVVGELLADNEKLMYEYLALLRRRKAGAKLARKGRETKNRKAKVNAGRDIRRAGREIQE